MAVYIVTGKLGAGKTLLAVMKILEYLKKKRRVAVNVDVRMNKLCRPGNKYSRVVRLPDLPTADDLIGLGMGSDVYDEEKFGGIFLDEAGVWLNSRDWNSGGRTDLLKFFLFLRKRRWDLWLIVQNINVIDKQIRESIAEHVVYINRLDRIKIPFLSPIGRFLTLGYWNGCLPKMHYAIVKYGAKFNSMKVDEWFYRGNEFYDFYDTTQEYDKEYDKGSYSMLPPGYWVRRIPAAARNVGFYMRTTKIFFRRTRVVTGFAVGALLAASVTFAAVYKPAPKMVQAEQAKVAPAPEPSKKLKEEFADFKVVSFQRFPDGIRYVLESAEGKRINSKDLAAKNITVKDRGASEALLVRDGDYLSIYR